MEEGKVILSTEEYRQLIERANFNEMMHREIIETRLEMERISNRHHEIISRIINLENKLENKI